MQAWHRPLPGGGSVEVRATGRTEGDLAVDGPADALRARRAAVVDRPWVWLRQVHGDAVVLVDDGDDPAAVAGHEADGLVTTRADVVLAVHGADCGIVGLWSPEGVIGAAHVGWRGAEAGVLAAVADRMAAAGARSIFAVAGPCIGPECYEFGTDELDRLAVDLGPSVRATTATGTPAFDLPAALGLQAAGAGIDLLPPTVCTSCAADEHWSFRARREHGRQALVIWRTSESGAPARDGSR